jgi:hypothetical protein
VGNKTVKVDSTISSAKCIAVEQFALLAAQEIAQ